MGLVAPVWPLLVEELAGAGPAQVSVIFGVLTSTYSVMSFLCAPFFGKLSDHFGRRGLMLVTLAGTTLDFLVSGTATSIWMLFVARIVAGIFGANVSTLFAYVADSSKPEDRAATFGTLSATLGVGAIVGPAIGGALGHVSLRAPIVVAALLAAANFAYVFFVLPESLPRERRLALNLSGTMPFASIHIFRRPARLGVLVLILLLFQLAAAMSQSVQILFLQARLEWGSRQIGAWLGTAAVVSVMSQGLLTRFAATRLGERRSIIVGLSMSVVGTFLFGMVERGWQAYAILCIAACAVIVTPTLHAMASRYVSSQQQGQFQGAFASVMSLPSMLGPLLGSSLFRQFSSSLTPLRLVSSPYAVAAAVVAVALGVSFRAFRTPETAYRRQSLSEKATPPAVLGE
jgi:DHA1 family tetracycline resistance protein-like MFS transporter